MKTKQILSIAALALSMFSATGALAQIVSNESMQVNTKAGRIQGYLDGNIYTFKGIQYAEAERFMPPTEVKAFDGVRMCRVYGPKAPQSENLRFRDFPQSDYDFGFQFNLEPMDESRCLVLNVWTPAIKTLKPQNLNTSKPQRLRPVFVWIHGGGYATGSGHDLDCYEGKALAAKGDIVVVTVNHRLNVLGYFDMSGLGGRYANSANLGQQDLVKALEWINQNIANFGGDPDCVTIGGQSGGGAKVSTLMMMPSAKGLFHRAIVQSGSFASYGDNRQSKAYAQALLAELGLREDEVERLNAVTYEDLVKAVNKSTAIVNATLGRQQRGFGGNQAPVIDGKTVVAPGFDRQAPDVSAEVPMLIGWNYNEFDFVGGKEDQMFRDAALRQAGLKARQGKAPAYVYEFCWKPVGNTLGACHGMELAFMMNNVGLQPEMNGATKEAYALSDKMSSAWINFIRTGNPNAKGLPAWKPFTDGEGQVMVFDNKPSTTMKKVPEQAQNNNQRRRPRFDAENPDVHDPVMARENGKYYIYMTGMWVAQFVSEDMKTWKSGPSLMPDTPSWATETVKGYRGHTWAPDIQKVGDTWYCYYSCSAFGKNTSAIGLMTNKTLDPESPNYKWEDQGMVVKSVPGQTNWNAIDPNMILDEKGQPWLTWGSFWDGIQLVQLDKDFKTPVGQPRTIARRYAPGRADKEISDEDRARANQAPDAGPNAIEAPFLIREGDYYYLFASWDYCCKGANSNYKTVVGRSKSITGPYLDKNGKDMAQGGGLIIAQRDDQYYGIGHTSAYKFDGQWWFAAHGYSRADNGASKLVLRKMQFDADGWPRLSSEK